MGGGKSNCVKFLVQKLVSMPVTSFKLGADGKSNFKVSSSLPKLSTSYSSSLVPTTVSGEPGEASYQNIPLLIFVAKTITFTNLSGG